MIELILKGVANDSSGSPLVVLTDEEEKKVLPLWVGVVEVQSIALAMDNLNMQRPLTHDLFINFCTQLEANISKIIIDDVKDNIFYSTIYIETKDKTIELDSRPSDAISLALKSSAPIYLKKELASKMVLLSQFLDQKKQSSLDSVFQLKSPKKVLH